MRITPTVSEPVKEYLDARRAADLANERLKKATTVLIQGMEDAKIKTNQWTDANGMKNTITYVKATRVEIDEVGLRKALTAKVFDKFTKKVLDKRAMEKAMDEGVVDPVVVAKFVTEKPSAPFLKYTVAEPKDDQ